MSDGAGHHERATEERLEHLRHEAARRGRVDETGGRIEGGPLPTGRSRSSPSKIDPDSAAKGPTSDAARQQDLVGYYGQPVVKPPVWTWEVPLYFFIGGLTGMSAAIALAALIASDTLALARVAAWTAVAGAIVSAALLTSDLGRPKRFLYMLRVFKWRSPMSMGAWILTAFGGSATLGAITVELSAHVGSNGLHVLAVALLIPAALVGAVLATYTGVLIAVTAIPAWFSHRTILPVHFGIAGLGSAAALFELFGFDLQALMAIGYIAASVETLVGAWIEFRRHGDADRALREGRSGLMLRVAGVLAGPASLVARLLGWRYVAAVSFLIGALLSRFGWLEAGRESGRDPRATFASQRNERTG